MPVIEPRSGLQMTTILAQSGPVIVRFDGRFLDPDDHRWKDVRFRGAAIAVKNGDGEWRAKLFRAVRRQTPETVLQALSARWLRGEVQGSWRPPRQ